MRFWLYPFLVLYCVLGGASGAQAHPHAWVSVKTTVLINDKGEAVALREHWLFDKMYSAYASDDFNPHKNGTFSSSDLLTLAHENVSNLKSYAYFTVVEDVHGNRIAFNPAQDIAGDFEAPPPSPRPRAMIFATPKAVAAEKKIHQDSKQIAMDFTVPFAAPVDLTKNALTYRIYDPTYYIDMSHYENNPVSFVREKDRTPVAGCQAKVELPKVDQSMAFSAAALDKNAAAPKDLGYYFSEKATISCLQLKP